MRNIWFTSDTHVNHANILAYCSRPFKTTKEMDEALIDNWNSVVKPEDTIYHLGDVGMGSPEFLSKTVLSKLNGHKHLLIGNHDHKLLKSNEFRSHFESIKDYDEIYIRDKQKIVLCHYPILSWNGAGHMPGSIMLHGHCHHTIDAQNIGIRRLDVGVDGFMNLTPISYDQIKEIIDNEKKYSILI